MTIPLASRLDRVAPSITLAVSARARELKRQGVDVISFAAGEPDFDTPEHIKAAARAALDRGVSKYTDVPGIVELRKAVAAEMKAVHGIEYSINQIIVSSGAKQSLFNAFFAMLQEGDEVIIPAPYWVSYADMVKLTGADAVIVDTRPEDGFKLTPQALSAAITPRTKALLLNSPCNPTGVVYERDRLQAIGDIVVERNLWIISDDIYRSLVYGAARYVSIASLSPEIGARTILIDGVSKTYAMTGWRIGYAAGPQPLIDAMGKVQGQSTTNASHIAQVAAIAALTGPQDCVAQMRAAFDERRREIVRRLQAIPGVRCAEPDGAFYAFPDLSAYIGRRTSDGRKLDDDVALCTYLVDAGNIALVPGSGFGAPGYARLAYACSMDDIRRGLDRLGEALSALR